ncbi:MAG: hypothetical protein ACRD3C_13300 [Vicinamibacterales bacterium]
MATRRASPHVLFARSHTLSVTAVSATMGPAGARNVGGGTLELRRNMGNAAHVVA